MFTGQEAKKSCPELDSHYKVRGWVQAANSFEAQQRMGLGVSLDNARLKEDAVKYANANYQRFSKLNSL